MGGLEAAILMPPNEENRARAAPRPPAAPAERVGQVLLGKWRLDALIGVGGMASVYSATHTNGRRAALKILHRALADDTNLRERFLREGYLGNKIAHSGRVECLDNDETEDGEPLLILELLEGSPLDVVWKRHGKRMPLLDVLRIVDCVLDCLAACHAAEIVHRDLKPANVFITKTGAVKVLDFGIAQLREVEVEHTRAGMALGTPSFMAPEQARGRGDQLDGRADLFSVGAMIFALVSGTRLHKGRSSDEALILAATQPAPSFATVAPDVPVEVVALVDKALAWDRRNRFASAIEMRDEVRRILALLGPEPAPAARAPAAQPAYPGEAPVQGRAPEVPSAPIAADHPDLVRIAAMFKQIERALPSVTQYGFAHPETERRTRAAFEDIAQALRDSPRGVTWSVGPYSFTHRGHPVWEPTAPLDAVPYGLFEAGLRTFTLTKGFDLGELGKLLELMLLDPAEDLPPEDDLATVLWDMGLPHVVVACADVFAEGDGAAREAFFEQADAIEERARKAAGASRREAQAMAVATDRSARGGREDMSIALDATARIAVRAQLEIPPERWRERYIDAIVDAYLEAKTRGDSPRLLAALGAATAASLGRGKLSEAVELHRSMVEVAGRRAPRGTEEAIRRELSSAMLGGAVIELFAASLAKLDPSRRETAIAAFSPALRDLGSADVPAALRALPALSDERLTAPLLEVIEREIAGNESAIADAIPNLPTPVARTLLGALGRQRSPTAISALSRLAESPNADVRAEATAERASSPEEAQTRLSALLEHADQGVRLAALRAMAHRRMKDAGPQLVRRIDDPAFHDLSRDEREALVGALHALNPARTETLAVSLLGQHGVIKSDSRDQTRVVAARYLGASGRSAEAIEALENAAKKWWWNSDELRSVAEASLQALRARGSAA